ncbi:M15 family metallopeptidase [Brevundimonas faecalis]|uniref:Peptidoglycan L-alanyl-D-glutamate endopeptidase CwlK n=1 Tax=Brevundimonas faecalis TaxID=947378 RepID=A0ABV2R9H0_9CAUL
MGFALGARSRANLKGVHPDLVGVVEEAIRLTEVDFAVTEGLRSKERQAALVDGQVRWDWPLYGRIAAAFKAAAKKRGVALTWGGDWMRLRDGPHFELDRRAYP